MKTAVVTGASRGIGRAVALGLASEGHHIVAAGRPGKRLDETAADIEEGGGTVAIFELNLASLASTRSAARAIGDTVKTVDVLVNCAGVGPTTRGLTEDGFEIHFGVNHLGHFSLTHHLTPLFRPGSRVVQVTSALHEVGDLDFSRLQQKTRTPTGVAEYSVSKLANILFSRELARRRPEWRSYAVHPGFTDTEMVPWYVKPFVARRLITTAQASETVIWCATSPDVEDDSGEYYARMSKGEASDAAQDDELAAELWERSEVWSGAAGKDG